MPVNRISKEAIMKMKRGQVNVADPAACVIKFYSNSLTLKLAFVVLVLIFQYHIFTGTRHMLMDFHFLNETLTSSFRSAVITLFLFLLNAIATIWIML